MTLAVLYVDERGETAIDAYAVMENAIDLFFKVNDPDRIDATRVADGIGRAHNSILSIAAKLLARQDAEVLPSRKGNATSVEGNVIRRDFTPPAVRQAEPSPRTAATVAFRDQPLPDVSAELPFRPEPMPSSVRLLRPSGDRSKQGSSTAPEAAPAVPAGKVFGLKRRRADADAQTLKLPRRLSRVEDALRADTIICLEDGKAVVDLGKHLSSLGMTPKQYRDKWGLPPTYPMKAPNFIQKHGIAYEYDASRNKMIRVVT